MPMLKVRTVAYKGSKRKLLENIEQFAEQINAKTVFDGFSGTGIVSAFFRSKGYTVCANDLNDSSYLYGRVFLEGYDQDTVQSVIEEMNTLKPIDGWLTENYSGTKERVIRGTNGRIEERPKAFSVANARKLDAAREYLETVDIPERDKNAAVFSVVLAADSVFNNGNDQKSSLKEWCTKAKRDVVFKMPTLVQGPVGTQHKGDIKDMDTPAVDFAYLDPPYTHGVLYSTCYHLNDSIASWHKPPLDHSYALPRPEKICFRKNGQSTGPFYSKQTATEDFSELIGSIDCKRLVLSYSDAPRNVLSIEELVEICSRYGECKVVSRDHRICTQANSMKKISSSLKEYFVVLDKEQNFHLDK
jgi:adenine-specific DNA methylase